MVLQYKSSTQDLKKILEEIDISLLDTDNRSDINGTYSLKTTENGTKLFSN